MPSSLPSFTQAILLHHNLCGHRTPMSISKAVVERTAKGNFFQAPDGILQMATAWPVSMHWSRLQRPAGICCDGKGGLWVWTSRSVSQRDRKRALEYKGQDGDEGQAPHTSARERQKTHRLEVEEVWVDLVLCGSGLGFVTNLVSLWRRRTTPLGNSFFRCNRKGLSNLAIGVS